MTNQDYEKQSVQAASVDRATKHTSIGLHHTQLSVQFIEHVNSQTVNTYSVITPDSECFFGRNKSGALIRYLQEIAFQVDDQISLDIELSI